MRMSLLCLRTTKRYKTELRTPKSTPEADQLIVVYIIAFAELDIYQKHLDIYTLL